MRIDLYNYQKEAINKLKTGSILCGGVGSGKSLTSLVYYFEKECGGKICGDIRPMTDKKDLYIITTARKRDTLEWDKECAKLSLSKHEDSSIFGVKVVIDSWNNISKYVDVKNCFFIFDEQRVVGAGTWVKSFITITKNNPWILLSATPGDTWMDYVPVFIANGFYKNRTEFIRRHVVYNQFAKYPKVERYVETGRLVRLKNQILVSMKYERPTRPHHIYKTSKYDKKLFNLVFKDRWNIFTDTPIRDASELCFALRKIVNSNLDRIKIIKDILTKHNKVIIFYNFNYELDILKEELSKLSEFDISEWNGHKHQEIPKSDKWIYLVQYSSGAEGWNCIETNVIIFYSQNYSYKMSAQALGRIDRLNTPFKDLYYYHIISDSFIDNSISKSLKEKKNFNEKDFVDSFSCA